jgi:hypothetical protein
MDGDETEHKATYLTQGWIKLFGVPRQW